MFKLDTHVHTAETSNCGNVAAEELVHLYKGAGYDGIVITDHYYNWYFQSLQTDTWEDKINTFLLGYNNALKAGNQVGLAVLLGMEIRFTENPNDYLVYGIDESFLLKNPELYLYTIKEFKQLAEKNELLIYQAHPFRPNLIPMPAEMLDGYEVYNGNPRHNSQNDLAFEYAQNNGLKMLSGSDFHQLPDLGTGGIIIENPVNSSKELVQVLCTQKIELIIP